MSIEHVKAFPKAQEPEAEVFPTLPEHGPQTGTVEIQLIVIMDGKVIVQDTQTVAKGCYTLETIVTPKDCCTPAAEAPSFGTLTRGDAVAFA